MEFDLALPAFLVRQRTPETREEVDRIISNFTTGARVWAPIKSAEECKALAPRKVMPIYAADPDFPVHVVMGEPAKNIQEYENFETFQKSHDFDDYPVKKILTAAGITYIQVVDRSTEGLVAVRPTGTYRKAGLRDLIWKRADELWTAAGKPKDVPTVLKLRKEWMNIMEKEGVKRTTASSELGTWQKDRLA